ncbi:uncharacterized protein Z519_03871 [Cladophialophora bantiana CBS 173.52]|uniref:NmrA-like domain-containing protein n=1 Tax=Cladophialophora bantiana (strain ATCC 10958 / CBS 173.52 / CDC B-1940 / NIH 8579) TaxID=1442370 RepID=A0A0D2G9H7_CLAB1|nr:uncharacterized protein Z519_03871 [Cladophialophora bantiana CBS 173.52]KIW95287.1 hypothetical protein Z519_03871 [Cladophialophora bantiana CBS 173.52]
MTAGEKLIVIIGATGTQGGSVVDSFLKLPGWRLRGVTRHPSGSKARKLAARGVEIVEADLDDLESLIRAFSGAHVIFGVTDFWKPLSDENLSKNRNQAQDLSRWGYEYELQQGKNIFDAATKIPTLERFVFSTIADVAEHSEGKYTGAYHADTKAHAERYGRQRYPELWKKTNTIQVGVYLSNFAKLSTEMPKKESDGSFNFVSQFAVETPLPFIAADEDTGPLVKALLNEPPGTKLMGYRAWMTFGEFVEIWRKILNVKAKVTTIPISDILDKMPGDLDSGVRTMLGEGMANMTEFGYKLREDPALTQPYELRHQPRLGSVEEWVRKQDWSAVLNNE